MSALGSPARERRNREDEFCVFHSARVLLSLAAGSDRSGRVLCVVRLSWPLMHIPCIHMCIYIEEWRTECGEPFINERCYRGSYFSYDTYRNPSIIAVKWCVAVKLNAWNLLGIWFTPPNVGGARAAGGGEGGVGLAWTFTTPTTNNTGAWNQIVRIDLCSLNYPRSKPSSEIVCILIISSPTLSSCYFEYDCSADLWL